MSKNKVRNKGMKGARTPFLVMRFGGMGDMMFATPVIKQLFMDGYAVDVATNEHSLPLLENNPYVNRAWEQTREGVIPLIDGKYPADLTFVDDGIIIPTIGLYSKYENNNKPKTETKLHPFNVVNYFRIIENYTLHEPLWPTMGADFINTYDNHFSWAHIDPMSVPADERRPQYFPKKEELEWARKVLEFFPRPIVMVQPYASSPVRTYYRTTEILDALKLQGSCTAIFWEPSPNSPFSGVWRVLFVCKDGKYSEVGRVIPWPGEEVTKYPIRASAALIANADLLVSADTCVALLAEAVETYHLTYYTSVPAWTRSRDYLYEFTLDSDNTESKTSKRVCKCGIIGRDCPRKLGDAFMALSDRDRLLLSFLPPEAKQGLNLPQYSPPSLEGKQPHEFLKTTPQAMEEAVKGVISKYESLRQCEAYCSRSLDVAGALTKVLACDIFLNRRVK